MTKLDLNSLRRMIRNEVMSIVDEDMLLDKPRPGEPHYIRNPHSVDTVGIDYEDEDDYEDDDICPTCGGYHDIEMRRGGCGDNSMQLMNEACGCAGKSSEMDDYSLDTMQRNSRPDRGFSRLRAPDDHDGSSYMARPQLAKIAKYASKLLSMIDENEELQDWQESHIAQLADDISEVYHSLEYGKYKG